MSRRRRSARDQALRAQSSRAKELRRRARGRRTATAATAAAVTLAGLAALPASPAAAASSSLAGCGDLATPGSDPSTGVAVGGTNFFTADDGVHETGRQCGQGEQHEHLPGGVGGHVQSANAPLGTTSRLRAATSAVAEHTAQTVR